MWAPPQAPNQPWMSTGAGVRLGIIARTSRLPPCTSGPQLGVCRAVSPVPPPGVCLILLLLCVSLQQSVRVVVGLLFFAFFFFFSFRGLFFFSFFFFFPQRLRQGCCLETGELFQFELFSADFLSLSFIHTTEP